MITKEQAIELGERGGEIHYGRCNEFLGPRGGVTNNIVRFRPNGRCKTWKTQPDRFHLPTKYGFRTYDYVDNHNADLFHLASECPLGVRV